MAADDDAKRGTIAGRCRVREILDRVGDKWSARCTGRAVQREVRRPARACWPDWSVGI